MKTSRRVFTVLLVLCVILTSIILMLDIQNSYATQKRIEKLEKSSKHIKETQFVEIPQEDGFSYIINIKNRDVYIRYDIDNNLWGIRPLYDENGEPMKEAELRNVDAMEYDINHKPTTKKQLEKVRKNIEKYRKSIPKDTFAQWG